MKPTEHTFITIPQFLEVVQRYSSSIGWIFRGQDKMNWPLCPKAGRPEYYLKATRWWEAEGQTSSDLGRFQVWRDEAVAFCDSIPENDFDCLAYAQHYGLATRLLDWTTNPLVALYFAVEEQGTEDGAVFCHFAWWQIDRTHSQMSKPPGRPQALRPLPFDRRIVAQNGVFTLHSEPQKPLEANVLPTEAKGVSVDDVDLVVLRVRPDMKAILQRQLSDLGISRKTLFPDLDGLSRFVNWQTAASTRARKGSEKDKPIDARGAGG